MQGCKGTVHKIAHHVIRSAELHALRTRMDSLKKFLMAPCRASVRLPLPILLRKSGAASGAAVPGHHNVVPMPLTPGRGKPARANSVDSARAPSVQDGCSCAAADGKMRRRIAIPIHRPKRGYREPRRGARAPAPPADPIRAPAPPAGVGGVGVLRHQQAVRPGPRGADRRGGGRGGARQRLAHRRLGLSRSAPAAGGARRHHLRGRG